MFRVPSFLWSLGLFVASTVTLAAQDQIPWLSDLRQARQQAEQTQRLVLLHFWSDSCLPCRALEQNVFNQPELVRVLTTNYIPVKINVMQQSRYADFYKIERVPTDVIVDASGRELYRRTSPSTVNNYIGMLDQVRATYATLGGKAADSLADAARQPSPYANALPPRNDLVSNTYADSPSEPANPNPPFDEQVTPSGRPAFGLSQPTPVQRTTVQNQFVSANTPIQPSTLTGDPGSDGSANRFGAPPVNAAAASPPIQNAFVPQGPGLPPNGSASQQPLPSEAPALPAAPSNPAPGLASPGMTAQAPAMSPGPQSPTSPAAEGPANLPPNIPPVCMDGFCPVTLVTMTKWVKGDPRWGAVHRGRTYLLASQSEQQMFLKEPDRYSPALSGYDPVRFAESRQLVDGRREYGVFFAGTYYLFADEAALLKFESQPHGYVNVVRQAMANTAPTR